MGELRFGLYDLLEHRPPTPLHLLYRERFALLAKAEAAGFWSYHTTEHHANPVDATPSPNLFLAAAAQHTSRIRLCTLVNVVPLYDMIRLAEEIVMLDHLSEGRIEIGLGKGIAPVELALFGKEQQHSNEAFESDVARLLGHLRDLDIGGAPMPAGPLQRPYPPLWYAGNGAYAAEIGFNAVVGGPTDRVVDKIAAFHQVRNAQAHEPRLDAGRATTVAVSRHVLVGPDQRKTEDRALRAWDRYHHNIRSHVRRTGTAPASNPTFDGDGRAALESGALLAGTAATVAASVRDLRERTGTDLMLASFCWGDLDHDEASESLDRFALDVMDRKRSSS